MNKKTSTALLLFLLAALIASYILPNLKNKIEQKHNIAQIPNLILHQSDAWNKGDLKDFMSLYQKSDSLPFMTAKGVEYGWQRLHDSYLKSYFSEIGKQGKLSFETEKIVLVESGICLVPGTWKLMRNGRSVTGRFSLIFKYFDKEGWKIIADHTW
ncbi:MAG: DUF4440 domain-containing protein [Bacteroidetes bacterium]|nr:DUF4440 domain-containing protein [Bacteroidota bacterium]